MTARKILIINTGGTITMSRQNNGALQAGAGEELSVLIGQLAEGLQSSFEVLPLTTVDGKILESKDSSAIGPLQWDALAAMIMLYNDEYSGFIILHGTDTMAYTAAALSFCLSANQKPVVLTGSQVPLSQAGSDGLQNLYLALYVVDQAGNTLPALTEIMICFAGQLLRGNRARKSSTRSAIGFSTPNVPILGELFPAPRIFAKQLAPAIEINKKLDEKSLGFSNKVLSMNLNPGIESGLLLNILNNSDIEGLVLRVFGNGTAPDAFNLAEVVEKVQQQTKNRFKCAMIVTDVYSGSLDLQRYAAGRNLRSPHIIDGRDMTPEAAIAKMMWVLGSDERESRLYELLQSSICGEITL